MIAAIENGQFRVTFSPTYIVSELLLMAFDAVTLILDMGIRLLRNHTEIPFLFGDAPVVSYNSYYRNVASRGVWPSIPRTSDQLAVDSISLLLLMDDNGILAATRPTPP